MEKIKSLLILSIILLGIISTLSQVIFIREFLVIFYGNELCLGLILAIWLFGIGSGAKIASLNIDRLRFAHWLYVFLYLLGLIFIPISIFLIRIGREIIYVPTGALIPFAPMLSLTFLSLFPLTFIFGYLFPTACHFYNLYDQISEKDVIPIGKVYVWESLGAFLAGSVFSFYLAGRFDHILILACATAFAALIIALLSLSLEGKLTKFISTIVALIIILASLGSIYKDRLKKIDDYLVERRFKSINPQLTLLETKNSKYQNIAVANLGDQHSILGNGNIYTSFPNPVDAQTYAHLIMVQHTKPLNVLLIGAGIEGLTEEILKYPIKKMDYVQLDPALIDITKKYIGQETKSALSDPRLNVNYLDGRQFVKSAKDKYDIIIVNVSDPSTAMLNRFYTKEFFRQAKKILEKNGVFAIIGITSSENYFGKDLANYVATIYKTLQSEFTEVLVIPGDMNHFICSDNAMMISLNYSTLAARFIEYDLKTNFFTHYHYKNLLQKERIDSLKENLEMAKPPFLNSDSRPISYYYNLILWGLFSSAGSQNILKVIGSVNLFFYLMVVILILFLLRLIIIKFIKISFKKQNEFNSKWAILTTGYFGIFSEILLIFAFQNIFGYVYERIGMIIGFFMLGIVFGARKINKLFECKKIENPIRHLLSYELSIFFFSLAILGIIALADTLNRFVPIFADFIFSYLIFLAGSFVGKEFPLASKIYLTTNNEIGRTAGIIDWMDLLGAAIGAFFAGTFLLPILGVVKSCILTAFLKLSSVLLIFITLGKNGKSIEKVK